MCRVRPSRRCVIDRIAALTAPGATGDLARSGDVALRKLKDEACAVENVVSYLRRLAEARIEIIDAEHQRAASAVRLGRISIGLGLPRILLAGESGRRDARYGGGAAAARRA